MKPTFKKLLVIFTLVIFKDQNFACTPKAPDLPATETEGTRKAKLPFLFQLLQIPPLTTVLGVPYPGFATRMLSLPSPQKNKYQDVGLTGSETLYFRSLSKPLDETTSTYNSFASSLYECLIGVATETEAPILPEESIGYQAVSISENIKGVFTTFKSTLEIHKEKMPEAVDNRNQLMRAVAHSLFDFNRADTMLVWRLLVSATNYARGTSLVESAAVSLRGEILELNGLAVDEKPMYGENYTLIANATEIFIDQLLEIWDTPFVQSLRESGRLTVRV